MADAATARAVKRQRTDDSDQAQASTDPINELSVTKPEAEREQDREKIVETACSLSKKHLEEVVCDLVMGNNFVARLVSTKTDQIIKKEEAWIEYFNDSTESMRCLASGMMEIGKNPIEVIQHIMSDLQSIEADTQVYSSAFTKNRATYIMLRILRAVCVSETHLGKEVRARSHGMEQPLLTVLGRLSDEQKEKLAGRFPLMKLFEDTVSSARKHGILLGLEDQLVKIVNLVKSRKEKQKKILQLQIQSRSIFEKMQKDWQEAGGNAEEKLTQLEELADRASQWAEELKKTAKAQNGGS